MGATKYPVNACGMRDGLSGDMLASSRGNLVPRPPNQKLLLTPLTSKTALKRSDIQ